MAKRRKSARTSEGSSNPELLKWAMYGLEQEIATTRERLETLEAQSRQLRSSTRSQGVVAADAATESSTPSPVRKRRKLSADARRRIADAQRRRWAKVRAQKKA